MTDWKPIESAPVGKVVRIGGWAEKPEWLDEVGQRKIEWRSKLGVARITNRRGFKTPENVWPVWATHYRDLPPPPQEGDNG